MGGLRRIGITHAVVLAAVLFALPATARAQNFPDKAIRIVVPFPPGAVTDAVTRIVAVELGKTIGQTVIVENRPGGGTVIGTQAVRQAPADGYTLLYQSNSLVTNLVALKQPGYKLGDFTAVGALGNGAYVMAMSAKHPFKTLAEFVQYAKANPGKLNFSSTGMASAASIVGFKLGRAAGIDWTEIPFKGGAEATNSVMAGDSDVFFASQGAPLIHANPDKLRLMAITSQSRSELLPNIPTFKELGYPMVVYEGWSALFARSDTPAPILSKLQAALGEVTRSATVRDQLAKLYLSPFDGTLDELRTQIAKEDADMLADYKSLGIEPQ